MRYAPIRAISDRGLDLVCHKSVTAQLSYDTECVTEELGKETSRISGLSRISIISISNGLFDKTVFADTTL